MVAAPSKPTGLTAHQPVHRLQSDRSCVEHLQLVRRRPERRSGLARLNGYVVGVPHDLRAAGMDCTEDAFVPGDCSLPGGVIELRTTLEVSSRCEHIKCEIALHDAVVPVIWKPRRLRSTRRQFIRREAQRGVDPGGWLRADRRVDTDHAGHPNP